MKKVVSVIVMLLVLSIATLSLAANFSDISGHWAEQFIIDLADRGVINGYPEGDFRPDGTLTYGEFFKLIVAASLPEADLSYVNTLIEHWSGPYTQVLINFNIIKDFDTSDENLNKPISRIEVVNILSKCDIKIRGNKQAGKELVFTDIEGIEDMDRTLLEHAVATGVIAGDPEGTFRPTESLKRSEVAKILHVYYGM